MQSIFQQAITEIDEQTGFRCRGVWGNTEKFQLHNHDYYEIFLTLVDNVVHFANGKRFLLKKNTLVFIRKNDSHLYTKTLKKQLILINIAFTEDIFDGLTKYLTDSFCYDELLNEEYPPYVELDERDKNWLLHQMEKLNSIQLNDFKTLKLNSRILIFQIFTKFFLKYSQSNEIAERDIPLWLYNLEQKMQRLEHFSQPPEHMVELSEKSRAHLGRVLQKHYSKTITEYINDLRLNYLANSIINTDQPILDLCYECGFENISWAYTLFKKKYGTSPLKFRNNYSKT